MWEVSNRTPFCADRTWIQDVDGRKWWVVALKATFEIDDAGTPNVADEQLPVLPAAEYVGEPGTSSVLYPLDLTGEKPGTDVIINAVAHAPSQKPTASVTVGIRIAGRQKALTVCGDRRYTQTLTGVAPSDPAPFVRMPLNYERAYGGFDDRNPDPAKQKLFEANPVGVGVAVDPDDLVGTPAPNITIPGADPTSSPAAGFGAVDSHWAPRSHYVGTYDAAWVEHRKPLLPTDFDPRHFHCAPADQQWARPLQGGERVELVNMSPSGTLGFALPIQRFIFETHISTRAKPVFHKANLSTVVVEPEHRRVAMVWHSAIPCHRDMDYLERTIVRQQRRV